MATREWQGQADAVAQITTVQVTAYDAATTYDLLVGGEVIATTSAQGTATATATALAAAWNLSTSPYATPITASSATDTVTLTADEPGVPFTVTTAVTGGTGTFGAVTEATANAGPNDWGTAGNWSGDTVPVNTDDVVFRDSAVDVRWGLDQAAVDLTSLTIEQTYTGKIGLYRGAVIVDAAGTTDPSKPEYREDYLTIGWTTCTIGEQHGPGAPAGSSRLKLDNDKVGASTTTVFNTSSSSFDANLPAVRLLAGDASADVLIRQAPGGVGIAVDDPAETATVGDVDISDTTPTSRVFIGDGVTLTNYVQQGGVNILRAAATITLAKCQGGDLTVEGTQLVTTLTVEGGTVFPNNVPAAGSAITTVNLDGGTVDGLRSRAARTWGTVNMREPGSTLRVDPGVVTITTLNDPTVPYTMNLS